MTKIAALTTKQVLVRLLTFSIPIAIFLVLLSVGLVAEGSQQFTDLANSFLHGHTYFLHPIGGLGQDPVYYMGKVYWDEGPFPAVILVPFVGLFDLFHLTFYQGYIKWLFVLGIAYFIYQLARNLKYSKEDSIMLLLAFTLASVFIGANSVSSGWLFAQIIATFLLLWALFEYYGRKRWWLIGLICGLVLLTRVTAAPIILFFILAIVLGHGEIRQKLINLAKLLILVLVACTLTGLYNVQRFGSPLDNGNKYQLLSPDSSEARSLGLFSIDHIPTNLYTALLRGPSITLRDNTSWTLRFPYITNNPLGMSVIITSPYLLYLFSTRWSKYPKEAKYLLIAAGVSALLVLTYFGDGADQFGYRYSLDFMPELFLVFMMIYRQNHKVLSTGMKTLIIGSAVFNFYILCTYIQ